MTSSEEPPANPPRHQPIRDLLLAQALDACIAAERTEPGSAQRIISRQPNWARAELQRLVALADSLDAAAANAVMSDEFRVRARARLMQRIGGAANAPLLLPAPRLAVVPAPVPRGGRRRRRWLWRGTAGLIAALVATMATLTASASALPGEPLYSLKQVQEELDYRLAADDPARTVALLRHAEARLDEAARLLRQGRITDALTATQSYDQAIERATAAFVVGGSDAAGARADETVAADIDSQLRLQQDQLVELLQSAPEPARADLREALQATRRGRDLVSSPRPLDAALGRGPHNAVNAAAPAPVVVGDAGSADGSGDDDAAGGPDAGTTGVTPAPAAAAAVTPGLAVGDGCDPPGGAGPRGGGRPACATAGPGGDARGAATPVATAGAPGPIHGVPAPAPANRPAAAAPSGSGGGGGASGANGNPGAARPAAAATRLDQGAGPGAGAGVHEDAGAHRAAGAILTAPPARDLADLLADASVPATGNSTMDVRGDRAAHDAGGPGGPDRARDEVPPAMRVPTATPVRRQPTPGPAMRAAQPRAAAPSSVPEPSIDADADAETADAPELIWPAAGARLAATAAETVTPTPKSALALAQAQTQADEERARARTPFAAAADGAGPGPADGAPPLVHQATLEPRPGTSGQAALVPTFPQVTPTPTLSPGPSPAASPTATATPTRRAAATPSSGSISGAGAPPSPPAAARSSATPTARAVTPTRPPTTDGRGDWRTLIPSRDGR